MELEEFTDRYVGDSPKIRAISVTSGKGGVGKSNIVTNLSIQLAKLGKKVLILDADFGLANIDILLNIHPEHTIEELFRDNLKIENIIMEGPIGIDIIPSASGIQEMTDLSIVQQKYLINELSRIQNNYDFLIIDTGAGIGTNTLRFNASVDEVIVVTNSEPTSLTDAYAMMKILSTKYEVKKFFLIVNNCSAEQGLKVYNLLKNVAAAHKNNFELVFLGNLPTDPRMYQAIKSRIPFAFSFPDAPLTKAIERVAHQVSFKPGESYQPPKDKNIWQRVFSWSQK